MKIANYLSNVIGPRVSGTVKEVETVDFLADEFKKIGLETSLQKFKYLGWHQETHPSITVVHPFNKILNVSPMAYTGSTPPEGVEGRLKHHGTFFLFPGLLDVPMYSVIDDQKETVANILVLPGSVSRPIPNPWDQIFQFPMVLTCEKEFSPIRDLMRAGKDVRVRLVSTSKYIQSVTSYNVVARIEGEHPDTIIVGGHHDSVENSPGATDNASGVEAIFRLADKLLKGKRAYSYNLITWGGHEWGLFGSQYFVKDAKERGVIDRIKACLTLDVFGCGDFLWIWAGPSSFRGKIESWAGHSDLADKREIRFENTLVGSDDWSFSKENIPNAMLMDWPADNLHLPTDSYENIDEQKVDFGVEVALYLLNQMDNERRGSKF